MAVRIMIRYVLLNVKYLRCLGRFLITYILANIYSDLVKKKINKTNMKTQNNMTSLISQAEWWVKKTQTNQVRGTFNWELFMKLIEAKRNENKKN